MNFPAFHIRNECPACASLNFKVIYQNPFTENPVRDYLEAFYTPQGKVEFEYLEEAEYILCDCHQCGLIFQQQILSDRLMERLYEHWIDPEKALIQSQSLDDLDSYLEYAQEIAQLIAYFKTTPTSLSFFDFGMGWGKWALLAKAFGCQSYGSELSKQRMLHAQSNGIKVISWEEIPQQQFDLINTEQVFEHLPKPLETLTHLKKALKPGGLLKISVPDASDIERRLRVMDWSAPPIT